jgi:hypothetical protein
MLSSAIQAMPLKLRIKKPNFNKTLKWIYACTIIFGMLAFLQSSFMLYKNFFSTMKQSERIFIVRGMIATQKVDIETFNAVIKNIEVKKSPCPESSGRNPFIANR